MMSSQVLVSRPHFDTRVVARNGSQPPVTNPETTVKENVYAGTSAGLATAGYRSAKYTPEEWITNNSALLNRAVVDRNRAENICHESKALKAETDAGTLRTQTEGTKHLGERLQDIHRWRSELARFIERLNAETHLLVGSRRRLEKALDATEIPFAIATDNLTCRERRFGPDLVEDPVQEELLKEVELIRSIQALLKKTLDQTLNQIRLNREVTQTLEFDWSDKQQAYNLDDQCGRYNNRSMDTQQHPSSAVLQDQVCDEEVWRKFTVDNLRLAEREETASQALRRLSERVLQETTEDLRAQCVTVDQAFIQRCMELSQSKTQLELHLGQILDQIGAQEKNISYLQQAVYDKEAPLRVAQSRLHNRTFRPNIELCRDQPQLSLLGEASELGSTVSALQQQLYEARRSLSDLEESRLALEKDIACKTNSLLIDREKCMTHRTRYPTVTVLSGY
ncbi:tektin-4 [Rhinichthys klamathensis goyatoka]|uniref:tektin-4 n=1 Tax=Rhinichthys klamathensis goyatoka TaxID=3034132 RepID=UPI0024B5B7F3|nr:tektin-4 [Rhinichthys klamathensis goyatoka]